jgi:hypothetical protein
MIAVVLPALDTVLRALAHHHELTLAACERLVQDFLQLTQPAVFAAIVAATAQRESGALNAAELFASRWIDR